MSIFKSDPTTLTVNDGWVTIHNGSDKDKTIRGDVHIPAAAITQVTEDNNVIRIHAQGIEHPAVKMTDAGQKNRYAVNFWRTSTCNEALSDVQKAVDEAKGQPAPEGWVPAPQHPEAVKAARVRPYSTTAKASNATDGTVQSLKEVVESLAEAGARAEEPLAPKWHESNLCSFGDIKVNGNKTITFNRTHYSVVGARAGVDMDLANNKKFGRGRVVMGAAAAPFVGLLAAPALIRKQKGIITLEVELADGTLLATVGKTKGGGQKAAQKVVQEITKMAGARSAQRPESTAAPAASDTASQISKLADLHARGLLTDEEYSAAKAKALGL